MHNNSSIDIIFEDSYLIAVNKRSGDLVQPGKASGSSPSAIVLEPALLDYLSRKELEKPYIGLVHRLDQPVSGVTVFGKSRYVTASLSAQFSSRKVKKLYWAVTESLPPFPEGSLVHYIKTDRRIGKSFSYESPVSGAKLAMLDYRVLGSSDHYHFLAIFPVTGRMHQIRSQLAAIGCSIKGDIKYGAKRTNRGGGIHLHARSVSFVHPAEKEELTISAPPPEDPLWDIFPV